MEQAPANAVYGGTTGAAQAGEWERVARAAWKGPDQTPPASMSTCWMHRQSDETVEGMADVTFHYECRDRCPHTPDLLQTVYRYVALDGGAAGAPA